MAGRIESYAEFWPFYLGQHSHPANRALHLAGTGAGIALLAAGLATLDWRPMVAAAVVGYGFAWPAISWSSATARPLSPIRCGRC